MRQLTLFVGGMSCRRCVREVTARLRDVPGVVTVRADAARSIIRLSGSMELSDVVAAFSGSTFATSLVPVAAETTTPAQGQPAGPTG